MILDWKADFDEAFRYSVFDAATGECLDGECIFYADDEAGYYLRHLGGPTGKYVWDSRTRERLTGTFRDPRNPIPDEFREVAWERVDRPIVIRRKAEGD